KPQRSCEQKSGEGIFEIGTGQKASAAQKLRQLSCGARDMPSALMRWPSLPPKETLPRQRSCNAAYTFSASSKIGYSCLISEDGRESRETPQVHHRASAHRVG